MTELDVSGREQLRTVKVIPNRTRFALRPLGWFLGMIAAMCAFGWWHQTNKPGPKDRLALTLFCVLFVFEIFCFVMVLRSGERMACPQCARRLRRTQRQRTDPPDAVWFDCPDCKVAWDTRMTDIQP